MLGLCFSVSKAIADRHDKRYKSRTFAPIVLQYVVLLVDVVQISKILYIKKDTVTIRGQLLRYFSSEQYFCLLGWFGSGARALCAPINSEK